MVEDNELNRLRELPSPPPRETARRKAVRLALNSFDAEQKNMSPTQGSSGQRRLTSIVKELWSRFMEKKLIAAPAIAGMLMVPLAGYISWEFINDRRFGPAVEVGPLEEAEVRKELAGNRQKFDDKREVRQDNQLGRGIAENKSQEFDQVTAADEVVAASPPVSAAQPKAMKRLRAQQANKPVGGLIAAEPSVRPVEAESRDRFQSHADNPVKTTTQDPVSTFSIDVDTASYAFVRRSLKEGLLPNPDSVRVEEMINYFPYDWKGPDSAEVPFNATVTVTPSPWNADTQLMHVGIKGFDITPAEKPHANLVFLIDVSGSMNAPDKLPLLKNAFRMLVNKLSPEDTVAIVTYAGNAGVVLEPTKASERSKLLNAIDQLQPGGSTAGEAGIRAAYQLARDAFVKNGVNRVMLATDGDFNVGPSDDKSLKRLIESERKSGIFLSVFGFGRGNYNDSLMQALAQNGNGTAAYIDTLAEAQKTLVDEAGSTLFPIAKDVKIQVEFNPQRVAEYRLIGYESRALKREDFNNDRVDAGDIGSGHSVTAIYEITPVGSPAVLNDGLRYKQAAEQAKPAGDRSGEYAFLKIRYKNPDADSSKLITTAITDQNAVSGLDAASDDVRFSVAVAAFGQKLRGTDAVANYTFEDMGQLATTARGADPYGYRSEFLSLVRLAGSLSPDTKPRQ